MPGVGSVPESSLRVDHHHHHHQFCLSSVNSTSSGNLEFCHGECRGAVDLLPRGELGRVRSVPPPPSPALQIKSSEMRSGPPISLVDALAAGPRHGLTTNSAPSRLAWSRLWCAVCGCGAACWSELRAVSQDGLQIGFPVVVRGRFATGCYVLAQSTRPGRPCSHVNVDSIRALLAQTGSPCTDRFLVPSLVPTGTPMS